MDEAASDFEPPPHPAGISRDEIVGAFPEADQLEQMGRSFAADAAPEAVELAVDIDVLPSGEIEIGGQRLRDYTDALADPSGLMYHILAGHDRVAGGGCDQRREHPGQVWSCPRRWVPADRTVRPGGPRSSRDQPP